MTSRGQVLCDLAKLQNNEENINRISTTSNMLSNSKKLGSDRRKRVFRQLTTYCQTSESDVGSSLSDDSDRDKNWEPGADDQQVDDDDDDDDDEICLDTIALMNDAPSSPDFIECSQDAKDLDEWINAIGDDNEIEPLNFDKVQEEDELIPVRVNTSKNDENSELPIEPAEKRKRKRKKADKSGWKKTIVKKLRLEGKSYVNRSGKVVPTKEPKPVDCSKCRFDCNHNFNEDHRRRLCQEYWNLADDKQQKIYLSSLIQNVPVKRVLASSQKNKSISRLYHLKCMNSGERKRVCLKFLCATFSISHRVTDCLMNKVSASGLYTGYDQRIDSKPANATSSENINHIKNHINLFPRVESHYCRKDSRKLYLSPDLNISKLYGLYKNDYCIENHIQPSSEYVYRKVFNSFDPPLSFYIPKKDQCTQCNIYQNCTDKTAIQEQWDAHKRRERESMEMKKEDKEKCIADGSTFRAITFDLQALLCVPYASDSQLYYKRKLNVHNFTIFDSHNSDGHCYVWDECNGKKGSCEIGTCLLDYLKNLPSSVTHVTSFSDTCGGQNRNKNIVAAILFAVNKFDSLSTIDLKYMESGHSYLEADSMHAAIERARKHKKIFTTREWALLISTARKKSYNVKTMLHSEIFDLSKLANEMLLNTNFNTEKEKVNWLKIKWLRVEKNDPYVVKYKYGLNEPFMSINIHQKRNKSRQRTWDCIELVPKYSNRLSVTKEKKSDLDCMIKQQIIPADYRPFYDEISCVSRPEAYSEYEDED
ncbi:hypothetical protein LSTR_LSTR015116 [Laodelphax striatellus]|uniref:Uncharacterized protein n=1 Tax=Laodelphax striatellus TaxID=195883 RepID=A0A482XVL9_LAOST|nr:hypothetical protein LSTR_LSTR015116 [Laodelphax striatellus]